MVEQCAVEQIAPVDELERPQRRCHTEAGGSLELVGTPSADVLDAPTVIGAEQVVLDQGTFVGVEHDVDGDVAVDVEGHLPARRGELVQDLVELDPRVVHVLLAVRPERNAGVGHGRAVAVGEGRGDVADPGRAIAPELDPGLLDHGLRGRQVQLFVGIVGERHVIQRDAQRGVRHRRECRIALLGGGVVGVVGGCGDPVGPHQLVEAGRTQQWMRDDLLQHHAGHWQHGGQLLGSAVTGAVLVAPEAAAHGIGRRLQVGPAHHLDQGGVEVDLVP